MTDSELPLLRPSVFDAFDGIAAAHTTRQGGVSDPPFNTMNMGMSTGDEPEHVTENRRRLAEALDFEADQLALAGQVHGERIKAVVAPGLFKGYDGLVTRSPGILLGITVADCAAVLLAVPGDGLVGACHAGWRGAVKRLPNKTVKAMARAGADPAQIHAYIGPCIGLEQFEVGEEVAKQFKRDFVARRDDWAKPHVDLKAAIRLQLVQAGVPEGQIETSPHCTASDTDRFFSYRAEDGTTGRLIGVIGLKE